MTDAHAPQPYRSTPIFDAQTLPGALRRDHRTKLGVWGVVRVLEGRLRLVYVETPGEAVVEPGRPGLLLPDQPHFVEPIGDMRMQVDFYDQPPALS